MKSGVIIQARMGSERLPGKVMLPLAGKPMLSRIIERIADCRTVEKIVIVTTRRPEDDPIVSLAKQSGVSFYRGSRDNVLSRFYRAATKYNLDIVTRITADCPLIDPEIIDEMVLRFKELNANGAHCDYLSNVIKRTFPRGLDVEIFKYGALKRVYNEAREKFDLEHVTPFITKNPHKFKLVNFTGSRDRSKLRWTVDEKDDYTLIRNIYKRIYSTNPKFRYKDVLRLFKMDPDLALINCKIRQK